MSVVDHDEVLAWRQFALEVEAVLVFGEGGLLEGVVSGVLGDEVERIVAPLVPEVGPHHALVAALEDDPEEGEVGVGVVGDVVVLVVLLGVVEDDEVPAHALHVAHAHVVLLVLLPPDDLPLLHQFSLQQPATPQLRVLPDPLLPLQLQELHQTAHDAQDDVDVVALQPEGLQPDAVPGPEGHDGLLLEFVLDECEQVLLVGAGEGEFLAAVEGLEFDDVDELGSDGLVVAVDLGHEFFVEAGEDGALVVGGEELLLLGGDWDVGVDGQVEEHALDHDFELVEPLGGEFGEEDVAEGCVGEPVDQDERVADGLAAEQARLQVGDAVGVAGLRVQLLRRQPLHALPARLVLAQRGRHVGEVGVDEAELLADVGGEVEEGEPDLPLVALHHALPAQGGDGLGLAAQGVHPTLSIIAFKQASIPMRRKNGQGYLHPVLSHYSLPPHLEPSPDDTSLSPITLLPTPEGRLRAQRSAEKLPFLSGELQRRPVGEELGKVEEWMSEALGRRRNERNLKKQGQLDYSAVSIGNDSALRLPPLPTPALNSEESKLVEEIRRVENRIKELKFQRSLASTQQEKYETMRPFMELQNQNLMNMQCMMMMAQQGRSQEHSCCSRNQPQILYLPAPPAPYPNYSNYPPPYPTHYAPPPPLAPQPLPASKKGEGKKVYNFAKIRKFRVAVIAVWYQLLLPRYATRFTRRRFQAHCGKYLGAGHHYNRLIDLATQHFSEINYYRIAKEVEGARKEKEVRRVAKSKTAKLIISEEYGEVKNYEIYLGDLEVFLLVLLREVAGALEAGALDGLAGELAVGNLPASFPLDHYYLEEELFRLQLHPRKLYLQVSPLHSKALLMVCFFVKLLVYDFLFVIREDTEWKQRLLKQNGLKKGQMIEAEMVATQMYISGILLHRYCMDLLSQQLGEAEGNLHLAAPACVPVPMGMMIYESKDEVDNDKHLREKGEGEEVVDFRLAEFKYIKKLSEFDSLMSEIIQKSGHQEEVKEKISDMVDQLHKRALHQRRLEYRELAASLLLEEKRLLANRVGLEKNQFEMPKRSSEESAEIRQFLKQMKEEKGSVEPTSSKASKSNKHLARGKRN